MLEERSLLAHLVPRLTASVENTATEALSFILNKSAECRAALNELLRDGDFSLAPIARVRTQVVYPDGQRPDLVGYDNGSVAILLVESNSGPRFSRTRPSGTSASWTRRGRAFCCSSPRRPGERHCGVRFAARWRSARPACGWCPRRRLA